MNPSCKIKIGNYVIISPTKYGRNGVISVKISSSADTLTDTAEIVLPYHIHFKGKDMKKQEIFNQGDEVEISLGYNGKNEMRFKGYISRVLPNEDLVLKCEDEMWKLKQRNISCSYKSVKLKTLLTDILGGVKFDAVDVDLGKFRVNDATVAKVLQELKEQYGIASWFRNGVLHCGLMFYNNLSKRIQFKYGNNIFEDGMDLEYYSKENVPLKVKAMSIQSDNKKIEVEVGDDGGDTITYTKYGVDKDTLQHLAEETLKKSRYTGFTGSFQSFGFPAVNHGDKAVLVYPNEKTKNGTYIIKGVETEFSTSNAYMQTINLGRKIA